MTFVWRFVHNAIVHPLMAFPWARDFNDGATIKAACEDCGLPYEDFPLDTVMPDADWLEIHPSGDGGLLCAGCIAKRAAKLPETIVVFARIVRGVEHAAFRAAKNVPWPRSDAGDGHQPERLERNLEVCICAAIRLPDGRVIRGHRHHDCFAAISLLVTVDRLIPSRQQERFEQGFVTSRNRFVDRVEGLALQRAAGIPSADPVRKGYGNQLFSEDLY